MDARPLHIQLVDQVVDGHKRLIDIIHDFENALVAEGS
jgi:hypothetical protein